MLVLDQPVPESYFFVRVDGQYVIALTSKSRLIGETIEQRKNVMERWKTQSKSLEDYILPGMTPDTALVIKLLANAPYRKLPLLQLHSQLKVASDCTLWLTVD